MPGQARSKFKAQVAAPHPVHHADDFRCCSCRFFRRARALCRASFGQARSRQVSIRTPDEPPRANSAKIAPGRPTRRASRERHATSKTVPSLRNGARSGLSIFRATRGAPIRHTRLRQKSKRRPRRSLCHRPARSARFVSHVTRARPTFRRSQQRRSGRSPHRSALRRQLFNRTRLVKRIAPWTT